MESNIIEYTGINDILGVTVIRNGKVSDDNSDLTFRYSADKILWSDYKPLNNKNLSSINVYDQKVTH